MSARRRRRVRAGISGQPLGSGPLPGRPVDRRIGGQHAAARRCRTSWLWPSCASGPCTPRSSPWCLVLLALIVLVVRAGLRAILRRLTAADRYGPVEERLRALVSDTKGDVLKELRRVGLPSHTWTLPLLAFRLVGKRRTAHAGPAARVRHRPRGAEGAAGRTAHAAGSRPWREPDPRRAGVARRPPRRRAHRARPGRARRAARTGWQAWSGPQQRAYVIAPGKLYPFDEVETMAGRGRPLPRHRRGHRAARRAAGLDGPSRQPRAAGAARPGVGGFVGARAHRLVGPSRRRRHRGRQEPARRSPHLPLSLHMRGLAAGRAGGRRARLRPVRRLRRPRRPRPRRIRSGSGCQFGR